MNSSEFTLGYKTVRNKKQSSLSVFPDNIHLLLFMKPRKNPEVFFSLNKKLNKITMFSATNVAPFSLIVFHKQSGIDEVWPVQCFHNMFEYIVAVCSICTLISGLCIVGFPDFNISFESDVI